MSLSSVCEEPVNIRLSRVSIEEIKSPSAQKRVIQANIEKNQFEQENYYSCCLKNRTDRRVLIYGTQVGFGIAVMAFSMAMIVTADSCQDTNAFMGLLTLVVGVFLPQPSIRKNN